MDNKILELCKSVVDSSLNELKLYGVKCGMYNVDCHECPFWYGNRDDNMECYENKNKTQEIAKKYIEDNENNKKESDNMNNKILKLCKSVANSSLNELELYGVECRGIDCRKCPFCRENRDDRMNCYENKNKIQEIARRYIENNVNNKKESDNVDNKKMKMIDIFNNWNNFKVDTEFYYEGIEEVVFSKDRYNDVVFKNDIYDFSLDSELIVKKPVEYVDFDDIKIGEEFIIEDDGCMLDATYVKVEAFNGVRVLEKGCDGNIFVVDINLSKTNGFKFIRK